MHNVAGDGLDRILAIGPAIASLTGPQMRLCRDVSRCPRPQCQITNDLLRRAKNAGTHAGRMGNSPVTCPLAISASLQEGSVTADSVTFCDASLEAFGLMSRELGRMILAQARLFLFCFLALAVKLDRGKQENAAGKIFGPELLTWATRCPISLWVMHLPGQQNQLADLISLQKPPSGDWRLPRRW